MLGSAPVLFSVATTLLIPNGCLTSTMVRGRWLDDWKEGNKKRKDFKSVLGCGKHL